MVAGSISSTPPPLPPTTEADRVAWLRLLRSHRVGPDNFLKLIQKFGTASEALLALPELARRRGILDYQPTLERVAIAELKRGKKLGARLLAYGERDYPARLYDLKAPPPLLWVLGQVDVLQRPSLAIVGARNATALGMRLTRHMAKDLCAAGYVIVSGLARGIDAVAHDAALSTGTVAVLGGAIDRVYPKENKALAIAVQEGGCIMSEAPLGTAPQAKLFPPRNRIIAGLSQAVVVIEAAHRSGTLITAHDALDIGREVLAVPGHPFDGHAAGCNRLIRDGATLVRSANDVLEALTPMAQPAAPPADPVPPEAPKAVPLQDLHQLVLERLSASPIAEDELIRSVGAPSAKIISLLAELEITGEVIRSRGGMVCRAG